MQFFTETVRIETGERDVSNITQQVADAVSGSDIDNGLCLVFSPHTTAGLTVNEDEPGLKQDLLEAFEKLVPTDGNYHHNSGAEDNAHAHLKEILAGPDHVVPVENGNLLLGTWQSILLIETDGPRQRQVTVCLLGE